MKSKTRTRLAVLGILAAAGLLTAGVGTALGAGNVFHGEGGIKAVMSGNNVTIYDGDREVQNFSLPENASYKWNASGSGIELHKMTEEEVKDEKSNRNNTDKTETAENEAELNETHKQGRNGLNKTKAAELNETAEKTGLDWEKSQEQINETAQKLESLNITSPAADRLLQNAEGHLSKAEQAFNSTKYGEAFGQAVAAEAIAKNAGRVNKTGKD